MSYIKYENGKILKELEVGQLVVADRAIDMVRASNISERNVLRDGLYQHEWLHKMVPEDISPPCKIPFVYEIPLQLYICLGRTTRHIGTICEETVSIAEGATPIPTGEVNFYSDARITVYILQPFEMERWRRPHAVPRQWIADTEVTIKEGMNKQQIMFMPGTADVTMMMEHGGME